MAPLGQDVQPVVTISPPHLGPPIPEVNSIWYKLWLYKSVRSGPSTALLSKGIRLRKLPEILKVYIYGTQIASLGGLIAASCSVLHHLVQ